VIHQLAVFNGGLPAAVAPHPLSLRVLADLVPAPPRLMNSVLLI
jgi:hypothetical protein